MRIYKWLMYALLLILGCKMVSAQINLLELKELKGLEIGVIAPSFDAVNQNEEWIHLDSVLKDGPLVVIFYRGQWCPYCNRHLSSFQDSLSLISEFGAKVVAISPEQPRYLKTMESKVDLSYDLLYDKGYKIASDYGLLFDTGVALRNRYNTILGADFKDAHQDDRGFLPIPATFIIDRDRRIIWKQFDPNYKARSSVLAILSVLSNLQ
jgi:peroxiredoxin